MLHCTGKLGIQFFFLPLHFDTDNLMQSLFADQHQTTVTMTLDPVGRDCDHDSGSVGRVGRSDLNFSKNINNLKDINTITSI